MYDTAILATRLITMEHKRKTTDIVRFFYYFTEQNEELGSSKVFTSTSPPTFPSALHMNKKITLSLFG